MGRGSCLVIAILALAGGATASTQCPDRLGAHHAVLAIEQASASNDEKVRLLEELARSYDKCELREDSVYARILHRLGDLYRLGGDFNKGIRFTKRAVAVNRKRSEATSENFLTNSYYNLGLYYSLLADFERGNEYFDSCIWAGMKSSQKTFIVLMACEQKGFNYFRMGEYQMGIDAADHGLWIAGKNNNEGYTGILLQQKAQSQLMLGSAEEAEVNASRAIEVLDGSDVRGEYLASALSTYARIMVARNDFPSAIRYYERSIGQNKALANWPQCSRDYMDLGYLYDYTLKDSAKAIACYKNAISVLPVNSDPYQLAGVYNNLGVVYWRNGEPEKALRFYQMGLNALPIGLTDTAVHINPSPAMIRLISNDYFVQTLLENKGESFLHLFRQTRDKEHLHHALQAFTAADKVIDQMRWKQVRERSKLFWRGKTRKMYENAVETCYLLGDIEKAFFFFEKSRAVLLNDKLNELGASKTLSDDDRQRDRELRLELQMLQAGFQQEGLAIDDRDRLQREWYAGQTELKKHNAVLKRKYPKYFQYRHDTTTNAIADLRKLLVNQEQTLVEYFTTDSVVYILMIGPSKTHLKRVDNALFREKVEMYLRFCSSPQLLNSAFHEFAVLSNSLYQDLFADIPVETKRVAVSLDDYFIPFESFLTRKDDPNSYLLRDHIFSYIYSADFLVHDDGVQRMESSLLGIAPVWYQSELNLSPLKGAEGSLQKIRRSVSESFFLTKETATKKSFIERFPDYAIVHVYSHAMADYAGDEPMLYFHDEAVLLKDLQLLPQVKTQLLVLSGCRTGIGKSIKGEGVLSLARGFAAAGIPATITTLWSVDDRVTYAIMENFYVHLEEGRSSDEALQLAKIDFLQSHDGENELPYYWASTVLLGRSMEMKPNSFAFGRIGVGVLAVVILLSTGAFLLRRRDAV